MATIPKLGDSIAATDYSIADNWAALPDLPSQDADVFVLYPTAYFAAAGGSPYCEITDPGMRQGALDFLMGDATAFTGAGNVFCPYYRQFDAFWVLAQPAEDVALYTAGIPATDILAAFDYYIQNLNNGRPYILACHSQGTNVAKSILFEYLKEEKNKQALKSLIAAYMLGFAVTSYELEANPHIPFAQGAEDTGVIVSYNTEAPGVTAPSTLLLPGAVSINPISWDRGETLAPASDNLGSWLDPAAPLKLTGEPLVREHFEHLADARVDKSRGVVVCSTVDIDQYSFPEPLWPVFAKGVYHMFDIGFYYENLKANAVARRDAFLNKASRKSMKS